MLKRGSKEMPRLPKEALFNLDGAASVKTIHNRHQKKETKKGEIDLTNDTDRDSASQPSSSSSDDDESSKGSRSNTSISGEEDESVTSGR